MLAPQRVMEIALQTDYPGISSKLRKRYADLLVARAVRFYIDGQLDDLVVQEDLYCGEDFDCSCSQEDADRNKHQAKCEYSNPLTKYVNLDYSEKGETQWQREQTKTLKDVQKISKN